MGHGIEPGPGTAGEDDALHRAAPPAVGVVQIDPLAVGAAGHLLDPVLMREIPLNGAPQTGSKGLRGTPTELAFDLGRVDGIAPVMAGPVSHEA